MELPTLDKFPKRVLAKIDIQRAFAVSRLIIAAERLQVFRLLDRRKMTAAAISSRIRIHQKFAAPFLNALVSLGLLDKRNNAYGNSQFAGKYFVAERPIEWTRRYSVECVNDYTALAAMEETLRRGRPCAWKPPDRRIDYVESMKRHHDEARDFTQMLFHLHQSEAEALAEAVDLSGYERVLDVAGGSGVMSIALARRNPHLRISVLDIEPVCKTARQNIRNAGLSNRVRTVAGDFKSSLPAGFDVIMFCDIGAIPVALLKRAYSSLPPGGLVILADSYLTDAGTDPLDRLLSGFGGSSFGLATGGEMAQSLKNCGFETVRTRKALGKLWIITGKKKPGPAGHRTSRGKRPRGR